MLRQANCNRILIVILILIPRQAGCRRTLIVIQAACNRIVILIHAACNRLVRQAACNRILIVILILIPRQAGCHRTLIVIQAACNRIVIVILIQAAYHHTVCECAVQMYQAMELPEVASKTPFILLSELMGTKSCKQDSTGKSAMAVLRHLGRINEQAIKGNKRMFTVGLSSCGH